MKCKNKLQSAGITSQQFTNLRKEFVHKVVKGTDIYHKTTPKEWKEFEQVIHKYGPFDIVLDGLNVAHCANPKFYSNSITNLTITEHNQRRGKPCAFSVIT